MKPPRLPPLIARRLREFEGAIRTEQASYDLKCYATKRETETARRRRTLTLAIRKAIAAGK